MMNKSVILSTIALGIGMFFTKAQERFTQKPLPYSYDAFTHVIDAETMQIHYTKHHKGYIDNLNKLIKIPDAEKLNLEQINQQISKFSTGIRNNAGGHYNHELFWNNLTPKRRTVPSPKLLQAINESFGNIGNLRKSLEDEGTKRFGSGWSWLYINKDQKLAVCSTPNQDNPLMDVSECKGTPILGIDVWEHAYYLKYQNKRADYLSKIWEIINWGEVSKRYEEHFK